jgi:hypothetical protein
LLLILIAEADRAMSIDLAVVGAGMRRYRDAEKTRQDTKGEGFGCLGAGYFY